MQFGLFKIIMCLFSIRWFLLFYFIFWWFQSCFFCQNSAHVCKSLEDSLIIPNLLPFFSGWKISYRSCLDILGVHRNCYRKRKWKLSKTFIVDIYFDTSHFFIDTFCLRLGPILVVSALCLLTKYFKMNCN